MPPIGNHETRRVAWRLCAAKYAATALSGEGARLFGGRWNEKGTPLVYGSSHLSLAVLEVLVHANTLPRDYVAIAVEIPAALRVDEWKASRLPRGWREIPAPAELAKMGTAWARAMSAVALIVPSAIVEHETNLLLNPLHADMRKVTVRPPERFAFDTRLKGGS
jgi:RES domain-containing protein